MGFKKFFATGAIAASLVAGTAAVPAAATPVQPVVHSSVQVATPTVVNVAAKASTKTMKTKSALNVRKNAGVKYKKVGTLKKGATVKVSKTKSGWSQIKSGKLSGWVSSKYLVAPGKAPVKKKNTSKKYAPKKIALSQVKTYGDAQRYLRESCKQVKIKKIGGRTSHYNPNTNTIAISSAHTKSYRMGFVFAHELSHHYQWKGHYQNRTRDWNRDIRNKKIEKQADQMSYYLTGKVGQGVYTKSKATGKNLTNVKNMINKGKRAGC